jgi:hypothetical protein
MDIQWQRGEFLKFQAAVKVRIGQNAQGVGHIEKGDMVEFDGTTLRYAGTEVNSTSVRGSVKAGWLVPFSIKDVGVPPAVQASRKIAKSQSVNTDLLNVSRSEPRIVKSSSTEEDTVMNINDRSTKFDGVTERSEPKKLVSKQTATNVSDVLAEHSKRTGSILRSPFDQDTVTVGSIRSPARATAIDVSKDADYAQHLQRLESQAKKSSKTITREGVQITSNLGEVSDVIQMDEEPGEVIGQVRKSKIATSEGIEVKDTSMSGIKSQSSNGGSKPFKIDPKIPARVRIAKHIDQKFPSDWDFSSKMKDRMDRLNSLKPSSTLLEAIYAAEGDNFRRMMEKTFSKQFG